MLIEYLSGRAAIREQLLKTCAQSTRPAGVAVAGVSEPFNGRPAITAPNPGNYLRVLLT